MANASTILPSYKEVYRKIRGAGLSADLIKRAILPSWWEKDVEQDLGALQEVYLEIAAKLGISYSSLIDKDKPVNLSAGVPQVAFKTGNKNKDAEKLSLSALIVGRLAQIVAKAYRQSHIYIPFQKRSAAESRSLILTGASWVSFPPLLDYCWRSGIPVLHCKGENGQAFDGMATVIDSVPVIILGSKKSTAWTNFHLAHELGHIMLGHVQDDQLVVDNQLKEHKEEQERKEAAANDFAKELLYGQNPLPKASPKISPKELQDLAIQTRISPASILQHICWRSGDKESYKILNARLKKMKSVFSTREKTNDLMRSKIGQDLESSLTGWQQDFLESLLA